MLPLVLAAISGAIGIISGLIQIYETMSKHPGPPPRKRQFQWSITLSTLLLAAILFLASLSSLSQSGANSGNVPAQASTHLQQGTAVTTLTAAQTVPPNPTSIPPTWTPTPPPQCTNQDGAPPNGPEATELMINCTLPSGTVALIVVCNEAHLLQPFDSQVQGPGIISYQNNSAGSSSLSIEAQNTALANASCPAKFLVVSPNQVDGQVAQEVQHLKNLVGNNAGVTYMKVVGGNVTRTYY